MSANVENISHNDFQNICRTCLNKCDVKFVGDNVISNVFYKLTHIDFKTNEDLPQQICSKCFEKINEIHEFASRCKQSHSILTNCLNTRISDKQDVIDSSDQHEKHKFEIKLEDTITIDDDIYTQVKAENLDPLNVDVNYEMITGGDDLEITTYEFNGNISETREINGVRPINYFEDAGCDVSNNDTNSSDSAKNSKKSSELEFKCEDCNKSYKNLKFLKKHKGSLNSMCPYKCKQCLKSFTQLSNLKQHLRLHSGELPYKCDQCSKSFNQLCSLQLHYRWHNGERPYKCDQCSKSFSQLSNMKDHKLTHSGERPHKCSQCFKAFTRASHLKYHMRNNCSERAR